MGETVTSSITHGLESLGQERLSWSKTKLEGDIYRVWRKGPRIGKCEKDTRIPPGNPKQLGATIRELSPAFL